MKRSINVGDVLRSKAHVGWDKWRVCAWHDTFNAVLGPAVVYVGPTKGRARAEEVADAIHGAIPYVDTEPGEAREHKGES